MSGVTKPLNSSAKTGTKSARGGLSDDGIILPVQVGVANDLAQRNNRLEFHQICFIERHRQSQEDSYEYAQIQEQCLLWKEFNHRPQVPVLTKSAAVEA